MKKFARSPRFKVAALFVLAMLLFQAADRLIRTDVDANPKRKRGSANESSLALRVGVNIAKAVPVRGTVEDIVFRRARHVSQKDLEEMTKDVRKGQPMDPAANKKAARAIRDYLKNQKGRYWAGVVLEEGSELTDRRVVFDVSEGPVLRVRSTQFVGGESLASPARLRSQIETSRAFLGPFSGHYDTGKVDDDVKKLTDYFHDNGYQNAQVSRELLFSPDFSQVDVIFRIKEGDRTKVHKVVISPNPAFSDAELRAVLRHQDSPYWREAKSVPDKHPLETASLRSLTSMMGTEAEATRPAPHNLDDQLRALRQRISQMFDETIAALRGLAGFKRPGGS